MVLMENLLPIVENQELRKNKREEFRSIHRLKSSNELFSCCRETFRWTGVRLKIQCCTHMVQRGEEC
jgi:hypothetical protein